MVTIHTLALQHAQLQALIRRDRNFYKLIRRIVVRSFRAGRLIIICLIEK